MGHLDEKRSALAEVQGKLQALNDDYDKKIIKKKVRCCYDDNQGIQF